MGSVLHTVQKDLTMLKPSTFNDKSTKSEQESERR